MTEFAYSGLGINPHFGTPRSPYDRATGRVAGGSSSGAAVSVAEGMAVAGIGTDTGGSTRIPAAFCDLTGFKPTARRVPIAGAYPLSFSLDSVGPLAPSVACCATVDAILAGEEPVELVPAPLGGLRLLAPTNYVREGLDAAVTAAFDGALAALRAAGARVDEVPLPVLDRIPALQVHGGLPGAEAHWWHRAQLEAHGDVYDPQIARRIRRGGSIAAWDYIDLLRGRSEAIAAFARESEGYDALIWPTVAIVPPPVAPLLADSDLYARINLLVLRNTSVVNVLDGCALSVPGRAPDGAPVGIMLAGRGGADARILRIGAALETLLAAG
jgi:aspartyl-tRNA(Asn)/glutamyl-tRNA(Gln) amidotransferase subunit A